MSASCAGESMVVSERPHSFTHRIVAWLRISATPTFAAMAILTRLPSDDGTRMICGVEPSSLLAGMAPMYLLMSLFHSAPWLKLIGNRVSRKSRRLTG
jgi:hypothetical protein